MSFPRYPKYKDSGVAWLGKVPEGWVVSCLKNTVKDIYSGGTPETGNPDYWAIDEENSIPWVAIGDMTRAAVVGRTDKQITRAGLASKRLRVLPKGTLLYSMYASLGKVAVLSEPATINQAILGIIPDSKKMAQDFLRYWLIQMERHLSLFFSSNTQNNLNAGKVRSLPLLVPNSGEQTVIAEFLDRETEKIDELVAEQRRLMELLKEKRQAVISHAVTKGLNPNAPMKPSGIEWLGEVPSHWEIWKMTHAFKKIGSGTTPTTDRREYYENGNNPWINTGDLNDGYLSESENKITDLALSDHSTLRTYSADSVVIAMYGATIGKLGILKIPASVNQACCVFTGVKEIQYKFLFYWLYAFRPIIISLASGGGQPNINQDALRALRVACPDLHEQSKIVSMIDVETAKNDALTAEAKRTIDLLHERRTALISAAVTGQIDVRNLLRN